MKRLAHLNLLVIVLSLLATCGPKFETIEVRYEIPYGSKYYRIDGVELAADKSKKPPGINVSEPRYLQTTGSFDATENEHAVTMAIAGKWDKAASKWEALAKKNPNDLAALNNRGVALSLLGRHSEAIKLFAKCMQKDSAEVYIYHYQATINLDTKYTPIHKSAEFAGDSPPTKAKESGKGNLKGTGR